MDRAERILAMTAMVLLLVVACGGNNTAYVAPLVIVNGVLIDGTGTDPIPDAVVIVDQGIIVAVGPAAGVDVPEEATVVNAQGGTILPGIIDVRASDLLNVLRVTEGQIDKFDLEIHLVRALQAGLTTVRATGWDMRRNPDVAEMRAALAAQGNAIPRVVFVGPLLTRTGGVMHHIYPDQAIGVDTVAEASEATEALIADGIEQIGILLPIPAAGRAASGDEPWPSLTLEQLQAIVQTAHAHDVPVIAQAAFPEDAALAVAAGVDQIPSWPVTNERLPDDLITLLVDNAIPIMTGYTVRAVKPHQGDARRFLDAGGTIALGALGGDPHDLAGDGQLLLVLHQGEEHEHLVAELVGLRRRDEEAAVVDERHVRGVQGALVLDCQ